MPIKSKITRAMAKVGGAPAPATDGFYLYDNVDCVSLDTANVDIVPLRGAFTKVPSLVGRQLLKVSAKVFCDQHASGKSIQYDPLLRACGLSQGIVASSIRYAPRSTGFENSDIWVDYNGLLYKATTAVGTFTMAGSAGQGVEINFDMTGVYNAPSNLAAEFNGFLPGPSVIETLKNASASILPSGSGTSYSCPTMVWKSFSFVRGADVQERMSACRASGLESLDIADTTETLEVVCEAPLLATNLGDYYAHLSSNRSHNVVLQWGVNKSGIWKLTCAQAILQNIELPDGEAGNRNLVLSYKLTHVTDDAQFTLDVDNTLF